MAAKLSIPISILFLLKSKVTYLYYLKDTAIQKDSATSFRRMLKYQAMPGKQLAYTDETCTRNITAIRDTLYVLSGKWKLPIIIALSGGPKRFKDLQRELPDITPKILSKELKELELNEFAPRTVYTTSRVTVEYALTKYSRSLNKIIEGMVEWGLQHRKRLMSKVNN